MIRKAKETDAQKIADIYNYYVENTVITFDEAPQSAEKFHKSINILLFRQDFEKGCVCFAVK